jgi:hypothetical protein
VLQLAGHSSLAVTQRYIEETPEARRKVLQLRYTPPGCLIREYEMTIATATSGGTVTLHWPLNDEQFAKLCALNPEMRFEYTHTGELIIMTGTGPWTGRTNARLTRLLDVWAEQEGHGFVCDSSTIFTLPSGPNVRPMSPGCGMSDGRR